MKRLEFYLAVLLLVFSIGFNLWLYRLEPSAKVDPNDNAFQFALVDRTNTVWDFAGKKCSGNFLLIRPICHITYLADHWVPNWAEGYNLPYYYSHIPQILIVASWRSFHWIIGLLGYSFIRLFPYYHWIIYLAWAVFPLSLFLAVRVIGGSWTIAGVGALLASQISTDGLYGLDAPSYLWRGYGLTSQLFAQLFMPLALSFSFRYLRDKTHLAQAVLFTILSTAGHLGIGIITLLSLGAIALSEPIFLFLRQQPAYNILEQGKIRLIRLSVIGGLVLLFLSYWIIPILVNDNYHNISFWDPVWKFNSYGAKETINRLLNGDLFDFGRFPVHTLLVLAGAGSLLLDDTGLGAFSFLFIFWLLFYFGRTTWGGLIDVIPGMKEFHLSRFIVGLHAAGMFLAPFGVSALASLLAKSTKRFLTIPVFTAILPFILGVILAVPIYNQTVIYSKFNDEFIIRANALYEPMQKDVEKLFNKLETLPPGRVFTGRGGSWGRNFRVAETPYYMHLSTYGVPVVLWLPETWSPNSDTEQYFSENKASDYDLYDIRYALTPRDRKPESFWKFMEESANWKLYEVATSGYITGGTMPATISSDKRSYINAVRLWIQSDYPKQRVFPELTFSSNYPQKAGLPNFRMTDEANYQVPDGSFHSLVGENPVYTISQVVPTVIKQSQDDDMQFAASVDVPNDCQSCIVILRQTSHPNWHATVDGQAAITHVVFPFFTGVEVPAGRHEVKFTYLPSSFKYITLLVESIIIIYFITYKLHKRFLLRKAKDLRDRSIRKTHDED